MYATIFLLIASTFLVTATAAPKIKQDPTYTVTFSGEIEGIVELSCRDRGKKWDLYGYVDFDLTFVGLDWDYNETLNWIGPQEGIMRIFISKETDEVMDMFFDFDRQTFDNGYDYPLYSLRSSTSDGIYDISQIFIERSGRGKKGSLSLSGIYITSLELDFVVTVDS